jgi:glycosyltransferase involved in cell wall biosynthesis
MEIVWKDRRVNCSDHLTPGLGPFGGKCVVKDMSELMVASNSPLLKMVHQVNGMTHESESRPIYPEVAVIIPTNHGIEYLARALDSITIQTYKPRKIVVVSDESNSETAKIGRVIDGYSNQLPIAHIINNGAQNVSGAINTGLEYLTSGNHLEDDTFIALLDDDDWWEHRYLENCVKFSYETKSDWIISGLIRYDESNLKGLKQTIPPSLAVTDFLVGNPNVQNSNLFVRANNFIAVDGLDSYLVSTTDRDVAIRLLQAGTNYSILFNHLVHHDAFSRAGRLSHPGSERKKSGLSTFYNKYNALMSEEQRNEFKTRAKKLFNIDIDERSC